MYLARVVFVVLAGLGLAACFTSKEPLITAEDAVFPFERIVFAEVSRPDDRQTWIRKDGAYGWRPEKTDEGEAMLRLKDVGENLYLVQMEFPNEGRTERLYGVVEVDLAGHRALSFASMKPDRFEPRPGLVLCDTSVCIEDLEAYLTYARGLIEAGVAPDAEYTVIGTE